MAFGLFYHPAALKKDLRKIPSDVKTKIKDAIEQKLVTDPVSTGNLLRHSLEGHRKFRVGDWRIIYRIDKNNVIILKIGHRKEVYEQAEKRTKK